MFSLVIDQGNTLAKVYLFDQDECVEQFFSENLTLRELGLFLVHKQFDAAIIAGVKALDEEIIHFISNMCRTLILNADTELPIHNAYQSPATLGSDRIAGACAAAELFPQKNCLIIAPTGSGKTECATIPIFSKLKTRKISNKIKALYITPLRALNRDIFKRIINYAENEELKIENRVGSIK